MAAPKSPKGDFNMEKITDHGIQIDLEALLILAIQAAEEGCREIL